MKTKITINVSDYDPYQNTGANDNAIAIAVNRVLRPEYRATAVYNTIRIWVTGFTSHSLHEIWIIHETAGVFQAIIDREIQPSAFPFIFSIDIPERFLLPKDEPRSRNIMEDLEFAYRHTE